MKKSSILIIAILAMFGISNITTVAQTVPSPLDWPSVPLEVAVKGRQAVVSDLLRKVDHITVEVVGKSVMTPDGWNNYYIGAKELQGLGYTDSGSFDQLSRAVNGYKFSCKILPYDTDYGQQFDVRLNIKVYSIDGKVAFIGYGYVPVSFGKGGGVVLEKTQSWVYLNDYLTLESSTWIAGAKYISETGYNDQNLAISSSNGIDSQIALSSYFLDTGHLALTLADGNVVVISLVDGLREVAEVAIGILSKLTSSEVTVLTNPSDSINWGDDLQFYQMDNKIYGWVPLLELVTKNGIMNVIGITATIDNTIVKKMLPEHVFVTPIKLYGEKNMGYSIGVESEILRLESGAWGVKLPAGIYHIRRIFENVNMSGACKG